MAVSVRHAKISAIADDPASVTAGEVVPSDWNAEHVVTGLGSMATESAADYVTAATAAATYQPLDGDLTALAALSGTNTIYYRSGAATWSDRKSTRLNSSHRT